MLIVIHVVKLYAHCYAWSEALRSIMYMEGSFVLIAINGVKYNAHCYTWSEALCSILYKGESLCSLLYMD